MLFHEIYGNYYNAVAAILAEAVKGELTEKRMNEIVSEKAFAESFLTVIPSLKNGKWQLIDEDLTTPLEHKPSMPLTVLQKRWLKAISLDPRIKLIATFWLIVVIFLCKSKAGGKGTGSRLWKWHYSDSYGSKDQRGEILWTGNPGGERRSCQKKCCLK